MELEKISKTHRHEGVCAVAFRRLPIEEEEFYSRLQDELDDAVGILALDGVENPHNVAALARTAAFFGVRYIVVDGESQVGNVVSSGAVARVSEGAIENVQFVVVESLPKFLRSMGDKGWKNFSTDVNGGEEVSFAIMPPRSCIVLGSEGEGISRRVAKCCHETLCIKGAGAVESLNVSAAAAIVIARWSACSM